MIRYYPITEARQNLPTLVDRAKRFMDENIITVKGKPAAVIMSIDHYESLLETLDVLSEPGALEEIRQAEKEMDQGKVYDWGDVRKEIEKDVQITSHRSNQKTA